MIKNKKYRRVLRVLLIFVMKIVCMECGRVKAGTSGEDISHGICAMCEVGLEKYRGGSVDAVKKDAKNLAELKLSVKDEVANNIKWVPPDNNLNWIDLVIDEEGRKFYEELKEEAESEINLGLKR